MATSTQTNHETHCNCNRGDLIERDQGGQALTLACSTCRRCWLLVIHPQFQVGIALRDFHCKRGDGPFQRPLDDLSMATRLVEHLVLDTWPSPTTVMDWGIETGGHYGALQHAVRSGVTAYELDRVVGDGPAITRLVRAVPEQPFDDVEFRTAWDALSWPDEDEAEAFDESASS